MNTLTYYNICFLILGILIGVAISINIFTRKLNKKTAGYMIINLKDIDTNQIKVHFTDPNKLFNESGSVIFNVLYENNENEDNREKK